MTKEERIEEIDRKCRMAGCSEKLAAKHANLFVREHWDPHPPADFVAWLADFFASESNMNPATAWNSDGDGEHSDGLAHTPDHRGYNEWIALGRPEPPPRNFNRAESKAKLAAAMAKIESRFSRGHEVTTEDRRLKGYDKR